MRTRLPVPAVVTALAAALAASGCATAGRAAPPAQEPSPRQQAAASLANTEWRLVELTRAGGSPVRVEPGSTLHFEGTSRFAAVACNSIGGPVRVTDRHLRFGDGGDVVSTLMACQGPGADVEEAFHAVTRDAVEWTVTGSRLRLRAADGGTLVYEAYDVLHADPAWRTIVEGEREGSRYRLYAVGSPEVRSIGVVSLDPHGRPGTLRGATPVPMSGEPGMLLSGQLGDSRYVCLFAPVGTVRMTHEATPGGPVVELTRYEVPGSRWPVFGGFVSAHTDADALTAYGPGGVELEPWTGW